MKKRDALIKTILTGLFMALAIILPLFTAGIDKFGQVLLPMHIPVLLCGFICGWQYGLIAGIISPLLRSLILQSPPISVALLMAFELAAYGFAAGLFYKIFPKKIIYLYLSLIAALLAGRVVYTAASFVSFSLGYGQFNFTGLLTTLTVTALPGIIIQIVLIPLVVKVTQPLYLRSQN